MKKLWLVTELFYPEETSTAYILTKIANQLVKDTELHVICGPSSYNDEKLTKSSANDRNFLDSRIVIHRVSDTKLDKNKILSRILRFILLSWKLTYTLFKNIRKGDQIFIVTNPAPLLILISLIKKIKGNKLYVLVHDVFPENTIPANILSSNKSFIYRFIKYFFDKAYRRADVLIVLGRDMKEILLNKLGENNHHTQVEIIENWSELDIIQAQSEKDKVLCPAGKVDIQYAGNLGRVQGLLMLLKLIKEANNPYLRFSFWGNGAVKTEMEEYVKRENLQDVHFRGSYKRNDQNKVLNSCDLAIITLAKGMRGLGVPSKSYNILAAGKPILFIGDLNSEIALLVKENHVGYCFDSTDYIGIRDFISSITVEKLEDFKFKGEKARHLAEEFYSQKYILGKFTHLVIGQ